MRKSEINLSLRNLTYTVCFGGSEYMRIPFSLLDAIISMLIYRTISPESFLVGTKAVLLDTLVKRSIIFMSQIRRECGKINAT